MSLINILRQPKIMNMAIFDFVMTFIAAYIIIVIAKTKFKRTLKILPTFLSLVILGVFVHCHFNIPTMLNYYLGINSYDDVIQSRKI